MKKKVNKINNKQKLNKTKWEFQTKKKKELYKIGQDSQCVNKLKTKKNSLKERNGSV